jgi:hypothetical protein
MQLQKEADGHYQSADYFSNDRSLNSEHFSASYSTKSFASDLFSPVMRNR